MKKTLVSLLVILLIWACEEEDLIVSVGENFIDSQTAISLIDSITVQMSTFKIDSISTTGTGYALAGAYVDSEFGTVSSNAYLQIDLPINNLGDINDDEIFDSLTIRLPFSGICYGDTLQWQTFNVHRVLEEIEPADDESYLYNTSTFKYETIPLGSCTLKPRPNFYDEMEFRLSDEMGIELMELLRNDNDEIESSTDFMEIFKGIAIVPGSENNVLLSFEADSALQLVLHTHIVGEEKTEKTYTFPYSTIYNHCNNISSKVSGLPLEKLTTQGNEVSSVDMDNKAYLEAGTGVVTRIDINGISKILEEERHNILYKAELVLKPVPGTIKEVLPPNYLLMYYTDKYNNLVSEVTDDDGEIVYGQYYGDEFYNESNYYTFDVTDFVYNELSDGYVDPDNGLLIMMPTTTFQSSAERVVFDARTSSKYRPKLNLYYVFYE